MIKKIICSFLIIMFVMTYIIPMSFVQAESVSLYSKHHTDYYLKFNNGNSVRTAVVMYNDGNEEYPAYCLEPTKEGIGDEGISNYDVELKDISSFSDNISSEGIWRIATHGYPYLTPTQMGCESVDEAYMATKQAIYRYLAGQDETYYGGGGIGEAGERVYNAIAKLLDYGYNHNDKIIDASVKIDKIKDLDFDEFDTNYYSATYVVSSNVLFERYTICIDTNFEGVLITDENNVLKNKFNKGERFKILIPRKKVENDFDIKIDAKLICETKVAFYGQSHDTALQSYIVTSNPYEEIIISDVLNVKKLQAEGKITIYKVEQNTNKPIEGVVFELYKDGEILNSGTTNTEGIVTFFNLDEGKYIIKERKTNSDYILNSHETEIELGLNETKEITVENEPVKIKVNIDKTGNQEVQKNEDINYTFYNIQNNSNIWLDSFKWFEYIPVKYLNVQEMTTGTWNENINYSVYYKTNKSNEFLLFKDNLNALEIYNLDFTTLALKSDEVITEICYDFGNVKEGFHEISKPTMRCVQMPNVHNGQKIINSTKVIGMYNGKTFYDIGKWTTIVHYLSEKIKVLPKTGI